MDSGQGCSTTTKSKSVYHSRGKVNTFLKQKLICVTYSVVNNYIRCIFSEGSSSVNVAAAVLIPLFLLVLIGIAVLVFVKRRTIQDHLSHYKFVRRST